jgi:SAM-dependent methyltransferase
MPELEWNRVRWNDEHPWPESGDEWSVGWGGPRAQWYGTIFPRINRWLPARKVLEIAPGFGRWTQFLLRHTEELYGIDLNPKCFSAYDRAHFIQNDGFSLEMVGDETIDFAFSFDSLVHAEIDVVTAYCQQIVRKLSATGVAFIHHSNAANGVDPQDPNASGRAQSVSSQAVRAVIEQAGGRVLIQEEINWSSTARVDCLTTFVRGQAYPHVGYTKLENNHFMLEMQIIQAYQSQYY